MKKMRDTKFRPPGLLKDYSDWFMRYQTDYEHSLEVPGQYSGDRKPMPEYHTRIAGFDDKASGKHFSFLYHYLVIRTPPPYQSGCIYGVLYLLNSTQALGLIFKEAVSLRLVEAVEVG